MKTQLKNNKGMTLIELTVVILVLLSLISVLFIGAKAWKDGSDKANCVMNIRNLQTAARSYGNINSNTGAVVATTVYQFMNGGEATSPTTPPTCPKAGTYSLNGAPNYDADPGTVFFQCSLGGVPVAKASATSTYHAPTIEQSGSW